MQINIDKLIGSLHKNKTIIIDWYHEQKDSNKIAPTNKK
jgi:hypothetical protein